MTTIAETRSLWQPDGPYLNTASFGLPPATAWDALEQALADWRHGRTSWEHWCEATDRSRELFGELVGVPAERVATGASVSYFVGLVAAGLPGGTRVLVPDGDFTSLTWPLLVRNVEVRRAPLRELADAIDRKTDAVAFSAVQSSDGTVADLDAIAAAAAEHAAFTLVDATHAIGWLPFDASRFDAVACPAYKWLMSPRGSAFLTLSDRASELAAPLAANWFAGAAPFESYFLPDLKLAEDASRLDLSPAWFSWVGTAPALRVLLDVGVDTVHAHDVGLVNRFREGLGLPPGNSAIVSVDVPGAEERLGRAGILAAVRGGSLRASFHLYNTEDDVDAALSVLLD